MNTQKEVIVDGWSRYARIYDPIRVASIDGTDTVPHDSGVVRALESEYRPDRRVRGRSERTVLVYGLNPRTGRERLAAEAARAGEVAACRLVRDAVTGRSRRYAFVEFATRAAAERAYRELHGESLDSATLAVDWELERELPGWRPRRLGGGFGGRRESGQLRFGCRRRPFVRPLLPPQSAAPSATCDSTHDSQTTPH